LKQLKALSQNDEDLLRGRTEAIGQILDNCKAERLTVVTGEPGMGVSSLIEAGIAPLLRREGCIVVIFRDWQGRAFATNLREAVVEAVRVQCDPLFFAPGEPLEELLEHVRRHTHKAVVILLDQFEDYVRCHSNTVASDFFDAELAHAVATRKGIFVIGLQEHAIPAFERLKQHIPNLLGFPVRLAALEIEDAREAVIAEARRIELEVEPAALEALVTATVVASAPGKAHPFFLKVAVATLLQGEARVKSRSLLAAAIETRGGVDRIVLESLDTSIAELNSTQADLLFRWCTLLISSEKHRLSVTEKGLTDFAGKLNKFVPTLLEQLTANGIFRAVETPDAVRYEIARECYAVILRDWWERREAVLVARRRAAFRVKSLTVAISAIVLMYIVWIIFGAQPK
jgi:hypothetical protein